MRSHTSHPSRSLLTKLLLPTLAAALLVAVAVSSGRRPSSPSGGRAEATPAPSQAREAYGRIPLSFEANRGQAEGSFDFIARGAGYALFLRPAEAVFALRVHEGDAVNKSSAGPDPQSRVLRMRLEGADVSAAAEGEGELEGKANYFVGDDPSRWLTNVPTFGRVRYREVYEGVDLVYYGNQRQLEYDFRVAPGADPRAVSLRFDGADGVEVTAEGDLLLALGRSVVSQPRPFIYQEVAGERRAVEGGYAVGEGGRVGFRLGEYDPALPLVIDPVIVYSTYLGGSGPDQAWSVAVDSSGSAYVAGFTTSTNFPTANALQAANGGFQDAFVAKLNAAGTALVYSTYIGGSAVEQARGLAVDSAGNAYISGHTGSANFPTANAIQAARGSNQDIFVAKLNAAGSALVYSTYLGGSGDLEFAEGIAVDSSGNAYVAGITNSPNFPTANPIQAAHAGAGDAFITKLNAAGSAFVYSTYLGGSGSEAAEGVAVDSSGNAYISGDTASANFPTANPIQAANAGGTSDAFAAKLNAAGSALVYSTYLGGSALDAAEAIALDSSGNAYISGHTNSTNFPLANAFETTNDGVVQDAFVTKLNAAGSALVYSTYLGGTGGEVGNGIAVDSSGNAYVTGGTSSLTTFPTASALQCTRNGGEDVFVTKLNAAGSALAHSTYLGGSVNEQGRAIAVDSAGNAYVVGNSTSNDFPVVNAVRSAWSGDVALGDAFVLKLGDTTAAPASQFQFTETTPSVGEDSGFLTLTVQRTGDTTAPATVDYTTANRDASERTDFTTALGTLHFGAGEAAKTLDILISQDSRVEGMELFNVALLNPTGGATLSCPAAFTTIQINDDAPEPAANPIDDSAVFVGMHYHDFLNRQADGPGHAHWVGVIESCGADAQCREVNRINVSTAFFLSIEFQQTGFLVFRIYKASFTDSPARPRGMPRYREFLRDTQEIGRGVVVNQGNWEQQLEANRQEFARRWVQRPDFLAEFPRGMIADDYINKLAANSGVTLTPAEFNIAFEGYSDTVEGRANTLRRVIESGSVYNAQFNAGFVLSQYIGYLRRNPNDPPEPNLDYAGFDHWLNKLNGFSLPGEDVRNPDVAFDRVRRSEMVKAFISSTEYRQRFAP